jgi:transcriptional regulator with XRE-family HTH domain
MRRPSAARKNDVLKANGESFGQRLARLRKERGFTQVEFAEKADTIQAIISDYERNKLRPYADVVVRFALILGVSTDELLGIHDRTAAARQGSRPNRRFLRRLESVDSLPKRDQDALLRTIDAFLARGAG